MLYLPMKQTQTDIMNTINTIKETNSLTEKEIKVIDFKKGDKVTYLGHPAVVTATKEYNGRDFVSVSYNKGKSKTKASDILATDGTVKAVS